LPKRIFLNIENIISSEWSAPYDVYLNLPPNEQPEKHPELYAGPLPMFGLREASRADGKHPPDGLFEQLDITKQYAYLAALPGWDAKSLRVSFVPRNREAKANLKVGRVSLYFA
jgi:tyrosinase